MMTLRILLMIVMTRVLVNPMIVINRLLMKRQIENKCSWETLSYLLPPNSTFRPVKLNF